MPIPRPSAVSGLRTTAARAASMVAVALAALCVLALSTSPAIAEDAEAVTSVPYGVRLAKPGASWKLLNKREAQAVVPDSIMGASKGVGVFAFVIVEESPGTRPEALAELLVANMPVEEKEASEIETLEFRGLDAAQYDVSGTIDGVRVRYLNTVVMRSGFAYQFIQFGSPIFLRDSARTEFLAAIKFLEGEVRPDEVVTETPDQEGIGWRMRDGVFESATGRLRVNKANGWRTVVGTELAAFSDDAQVCLEHASPELYLQVIDERAPATDRETFAANLIEQNLEAFGAERVGKPTSHVIGGVTTNVEHVRTTGGAGIDYHIAVLFAGDRCYQIQVWYMTGLGDRAASLVPEALATIEFLGPEENARLTLELQGSSTAQVAVDGPDAVRGRRYWNFDHGVEWTAPKGFWSITVGTEARMQNDSIAAAISDLERGTLAQFVIEPALEFDATTYHEVVREMFAGHENVELSDVRVHGTKTLPIQRTTVSSTVSGLDLQWEVSTLVKGGTAMQIIAWELAGNAQATRDAADAILAGLRVDQSIRATVETAASLTDNRFGFRMRPPPAVWRHTDETPGMVDSAASLHSWKKDGFEFFVMAFILPNDGGAELFDDLISREITARLGALGGREPTVGEYTLAGEPGTHTKWEATGARADLIQVRVGRRSFALGVITPSGTTSPSLEKVAAGFKILD